MMLDPRFYRLEKDEHGQLAIGVSGSREAQKADHYRIIAGTMEMVFSLTRASMLVHGGCVGVDTLAGAAVFNRLGASRGVIVHVVYPDGYRTSRLIGSSDNIDSYEEMPAGTTLLQRDQRVVDLVAGLVAFPLYPEDHPNSKRSGTWATIRMAQRKDIPVAVLPLNYR